MEPEQKLPATPALQKNEMLTSFSRTPCACYLIVGQVSREEYLLGAEVCHSGSVGRAPAWQVGYPDLIPDYCIGYFFFVFPITIYFVFVSFIFLLHILK